VGRYLHHVLSALATGCLLLALPSCTSSATSPPTSSSTLPSRQIVYATAVAELGDYLLTWQQSGPRIASRQFLVPSQRGGSLVLRSGRVISYKAVTWTSRDEFTLFVTIDLKFSGSSGAWDDGRNDRFVTFLHSGTRPPYEMQFATSP